MKIRRQTLLPCSAEDAWAAVQTSRLLEEVSDPVVRLRPPRGEKSLPRKWANLSTNHMRPLLFGLLPWPIRTMTIERLDSRRRVIQTREFDALVSKWDHLIAIEPVDRRHCRYVDDVEVRAGLLTPLVWLFATLFYRHRQRRWRRVAQRLTAAPATPSTMMGLA
jgi:hypothetical protein